MRPPRARVLNYDPALLDEETDLPEETKHEILEVFSLLDDANHYTMLGVERTAEKKDIKAAYFVLVQQFHADRFFGKKLGTFKGRIDRIFAALTKAHDTLARNRSRAQYDAYLKSREETLGARDSVAPRRIMQARRGAGQEHECCAEQQQRKGISGTTLGTTGPSDGDIWRRAAEMALLCRATTLHQGSQGHERPGGIAHTRTLAKKGLGRLASTSENWG